VRVDYRASSCVLQITDGDDAIAFDCDVAFDWRRARAVIDGAVFDEDVES
jgi:hypothetical protein